MDDWKTRLQKEYEELAERTGKLDLFLCSSAAVELDAENLRLLDIQHRIMRSYLNVLRHRADLNGIDLAGYSSLEER